MNGFTMTVLGQPKSSTAAKVSQEVKSAGENLKEGVFDFSTALNDALYSVVGVLPDLLAMVLIVVIGYIVSLVVSRGVRALGERIGLEKAADKSGLAMVFTGVRHFRH